MEEKAKIKEGLGIDENSGSRKRELDMEGLGEFNKAVNDSFDSIFNKELDLEIEEVPMVLFELHENALFYLDREEWDKALVLLQKAQIIIDLVQNARRLWSDQNYKKLAQGLDNIFKIRNKITLKIIIVVWIRGRQLNKR